MTTHLYSASLLSAAFPLREGALDVHPATMWPDPLVPANGAFSPRALPTFLPFGHAMATHGLRARGLFCCDGTGLPWNYWNFLRSHFARALTRESLSDHDIYVGDFRRLAEVESVEESSRGVLIQSMSFS